MKLVKRISKKFRKHLWPITPWMIFFAALTIIICANVSALVILHTRHDNNITPLNTTSSTSRINTGATPAQKPNTSVQTTPPATTTNNSVKSNAATVSGSTLDKYGCVTGTPGYSQCVKDAIVLWCNNQISQPALDFNSATLQARTAYNTVMNEWQTEQYKTPHSPYSEYLADATDKFNAIYNPAFSTYTAKVQSLNSQGCSLQYPTRESAGQYY